MKFGYSRNEIYDCEFQKEMDFLPLVGCSQVYYDIIPLNLRFGNNFLKLIEKGKKKDLIIVYSFSRLGGTLSELSTICAYLSTMKMGLISLKDQFNSNSFEGGLFFQSMSELSHDFSGNENPLPNGLKF
jgi:hypothetical protein